MPGLERMSVRDFHSGAKRGSLCSGFVQAKQEFGGNVENAEGCPSPSRTHIKRTVRLGYLIPLEDPTRKETQSKGLRSVLTAVTTPAGSLHP